MPGLSRFNTIACRALSWLLVSFMRAPVSASAPYENRTVGHDNPTNGNGCPDSRTGALADGRKSGL
jgi:hypothetical protein